MNNSNNMYENQACSVASWFLVSLLHMLCFVLHNGDSIMSSSLTKHFDCWQSDDDLHSARPVFVANGITDTFLQISNVQTIQYIDSRRRQNLPMKSVNAC